ncbi:MAG TPA: TLC domain-containing protein [Acidobacteriota bacterium]
MSQTHAVIVLFLNHAAVDWEANPSLDSRTRVGTLSLVFSMVYSVYDTHQCYYDTERGAQYWVNLIHAIVLGLGTSFMTLVCGKFSMAVLLLYRMEFSTLFYNMIFFVEHDSRAHKVFQIAFSVSFVCIRSIWQPFVIIRYLIPKLIATHDDRVTIWVGLGLLNCTLVLTAIRSIQIVHSFAPESAKHVVPGHESSAKSDIHPSRVPGLTTGHN